MMLLPACFCKKNITLFAVLSLVSITSSASFIRNSADSYQNYYINTSYPFLEQVAQKIQHYYHIYGQCPTDNSYELQLPDDSYFSQVTNKRCVALATFKPQGVSPALQNGIIGMAPRYNIVTSQWDFNHMRYATDIHSGQQKYNPTDGSTSTLLNNSDYFIGGRYAVSVFNYLSVQDNKQPEVK